MADKASNPAAAKVQAADQRPGSSSSSAPTTEQSQTQGTNSPGSSNSSTSIPCQWTGCGEYHPTPEALYDHVCEKHVGRKSTNNLNLTCAWGNCHTTTVKRDHITSHIRVHVPLKPHKCDLCGKSFKRPQDLKKHVKTHAEDPNQSMRHDAGSSRGHHHHQNGYPMPAPPRMDGYGGYPGMQAHPGVNYPYHAQGPNMHYVPTSHGGAHHGGHYGPVYYPAAAPIGHTNFSDGHDGGFAATQRLFDDIRQKSFDPKDYGAVNNLLMGMQHFQLPLPVGGGGGGDYGGGPMVVGAPGGFYGPGSMHAQDAPSFPNIRTKKDLLEINEILQQMTATTYEAPTPLPASSGSGHTGPSAAPHRLSHSPPSITLPNAHEVAAIETPALTPDSMSYTSGASPPAVHSNMVSPTTASQPAYPTLSNVPDGGSQAGMAPVDTLGTQYDHDVRRRYSGGNLQQSQPAARRGSADMDVDSAPSTRRPRRRDANIDPLLGGSTGSSGSSSRGSIGSDETTTPTGREEAARGFNLRLLDSLRSYISGKLESGEFDDEDSDGDNSSTDERVRKALASEAERRDMDMDDDDDDAGPSHQAPKPDVAYPELNM